MTWLRRAAVALSVLLVCGTVVFACGRISERGRFTVAYSTHGAGPAGTRALYELTEQLGLKPVRWARELSNLPAGAVLVVTGGCEGGLARPLSRPERETLTAWVERGGHVIAAGVDDVLPDSLGLGFGTAATCHSADENPFEFAPEPPENTDAQTPWAVQVVARPGALEHMQPFTLYGGRRVKDTSPEDSDAGGQVLLDSEVGPMAMRREHGRGSVTLLGTGSPLQNRALSQHGAALFERLLRATHSKGPVLFDEYHLGLGERRSLVRYLRDMDAGAAALQLLLAVALGLWGRGARLGDPRPAPEAPPGGSGDYVRAMGDLYARSEDAPGAAAVLAARALSHIARHYSIRIALDADLAQALRDRGHAAVAEYAERIQAHGRETPGSTEQLLTLSRAIDEDRRAALVIGKIP